MLLFWRIRYLDSRDRTFKDRDLWLETDTLDPATRSAVELCDQLRDSGHQRRWLRSRHLFRAEDLSDDERKARWGRHDRFSSVSLHDYLEDENGKELSRKRMAKTLTGSPTAILLPPGARQHDVDYVLADKRPIPIDQVTLSADDLHILGYFTRDLREMLASAFYKDGPGTLSSVGHAGPEFRTAVSDEEIRSFVTIFRRLYMAKEPAGFLKAVEVFARVTQGYPLGNWIAGVGTEYERGLGEPPHMVPYVGQAHFQIKRKRLIDVFLYTRYAHQPSDKWARQYDECLAAVGGRRGLLTWLFLTTMWERSLHMRNAGVIMADFFDRYCRAHGVACDVLLSVARDNPGIGQLEKKEDRERRLFEESVKRLGQQTWANAGKPPGGPERFMEVARQELGNLVRPSKTGARAVRRADSRAADRVNTGS
jgi:hypothetical protein